MSRPRVLIMMSQTKGREMESLMFGHPTPVLLKGMGMFIMGKHFFLGILQLLFESRNICGILPQLHGVLVV